MLQQVLIANWVCVDQFYIYIILYIFYFIYSFIHTMVWTKSSVQREVLVFYTAGNGTELCRVPVSTDKLGLNRLHEVSLTTQIFILKWFMETEGTREAWGAKGWLCKAWGLFFFFLHLTQWIRVYFDQTRVMIFSTTERQSKKVLISLTFLCLCWLSACWLAC